MANESSHPLTPDEAKTRLRQSASCASPAILIQRYPWQATGLALICGLILGRTNVQSVISQRRVSPLLWRLVSGVLLAPKGKLSCQSSGVK